MISFLINVAGVIKQAVLQECNYDLTTVVTPINIQRYEKLLKESKYDEDKTKYLLDGLRNGFRMGFQGPRDIVRETPNMKFRTGTKVDLWNKIMKEVREKHTAGPYRGRANLPLTKYWQNPVGLLPKKGNPGETRMIVNLSYTDEFSINHFTNKDECKVKYRDMDSAVDMIMKIHHKYGRVYLSKCDGRAAFRQLPISPQDYQLLVMKAEDPDTGETCYFIDKVVVFGSSKSCRIFSDFAASLAHIARHLDKYGRRPNEYLDDVLNAGHDVQSCNQSLTTYLQMCEWINFPISEEKTEWATQIIVFLGLLINTITLTLGIPIEKRDEALNQIDNILRSRRITMHVLQRLVGLLNFLSRAIVPGRTYNRRFYDRMIGLKQHHHLRVDMELRKDLDVWKQFLKKPDSLCRPFVDFSHELVADSLDFYTDASLSEKHAAFGVVFGKEWTYANFPQWVRHSPEVNIQTLEMYALTVGIVLFAKSLRGKRVKVYCDNQAVVGMVNNGTSRCRTCMNFIRILTKFAMKYQVRIFVQYIESLKNTRADALSRLDWNRFWQASPPNTTKTPLPLPLDIWPLRREWWGLNESDC